MHSSNGRGSRSLFKGYHWGSPFLTRTSGEDWKNPIPSATSCQEVREVGVLWFVWHPSWWQLYPGPRWWRLYPGPRWWWLYPGPRWWRLYPGLRWWWLYPGLGWWQLYPGLRAGSSVNGKGLRASPERWRLAEEQRQAPWVGRLIQALEATSGSVEGWLQGQMDLGLNPDSASFWLYHLI